MRNIYKPNHDATEFLVSPDVLLACTFERESDSVREKADSFACFGDFPQETYSAVLTPAVSLATVPSASGMALTSRLFTELAGPRIIYPCGPAFSPVGDRSIWMSRLTLVRPQPPALVAISSGRGGHSWTKLRSSTRRRSGRAGVVGSGADADSETYRPRACWA